MRIAFVLPGGGGGGGARVIVRLVDGLVAAGHDARLFHPFEHKNITHHLRAAYIGLRYGHRDNWLRICSARVQAYTQLTPDLLGDNDVVVAVGVTSVLAIADLPASCGIKVHNSHGTEPWIPDLMRQAWQLPMPRIVSASHIKRLMRDAGSTDPIYIVHNGIDANEYFASLPHNLRDGVGTVYHGASPKDPATIIEVLHEVHRAHPQVPLRLFGAFPRPTGLPPATAYVRLPSLQDARDIYSRCKVWFCASRHEGFGLPILEAMACGCAVVSTDCGGPSDIIKPGTTGWLVPVGDAGQLAMRINQLLDNEPLRQSFVSASMATLKQFTWTRTIHGYEAALRAIVAMRDAQSAQTEAPALPGTAGDQP